MPGYALVSIGNYAFFSCSALTSITIPVGVTSIGDYAFTYCSALASVTIPASVASIGNYAFYYCSGLTSVTIPDSVASIGDYAFWHCTDLTSVTIPASVTSIGSYAFEYCALTSITIPNGVTSIGNSAFSYCALTSVMIPGSVTNIGYRAFIGAQIGRSLASITVHPDNPYYASVDGVLFDKELTVLIQCPAGFSGAVTVPSSVTNICDYAFSSCNSLSSILFMGAPPVLGTSVFNGTHTVIYYRKGTPGWADSFGGQPATPFPFDFSLEALAKPPRDMGVPPMKHGQDARATPARKGFCRIF
jgi:hypothetical protein